MSASDISLLLKEVREGSEEAREALFEALHEQLRGHARGLMNNERVDHTLQATALVHEACVRILNEGVVDSAENRRQLFHASIRAMRQVLMEHARARGRKKRGGGLERQPLDIILDNFESKHDLSFLDVDEALKRLQKDSPDQYEVLVLRFFAGLTVIQTAEILDCSQSTVETRWRFARARLLTWLG